MVTLKILKNGTYQIKTFNVTAYANTGIPMPATEFHSVNIIGKTATYRFNGWVKKYVSSYKYEWDFGDGKTSNEVITNHTFDLKPTEQKVKIVFTATSVAGCRSKDSFDIILPAAYEIQDSIRYTFTDPCSSYGEEFTFIGPTKNIPSGAQYIWDFRDGKTADINFAKHRFANVKTVPVTLKIVYDNRDLFNSNIIVRTKGQDAIPPAELKLCCQYLSATYQKWFFQNTVSGNEGGNILNWKWNFGDGSPILDGKVDSYKYEFNRLNSDTSYWVKMEVTAESGCKNIDSTKIFVPKL